MLLGSQTAGSERLVAGQGVGRRVIMTAPGTELSLRQGVGDGGHGEGE